MREASREAGSGSIMQRLTIALWPLAYSLLLFSPRLPSKAILYFKLP
jgi:hypothetical protein